MLVLAGWLHLAAVLAYAGAAAAYATGWTRTSSVAVARGFWALAIGAACHVLVLVIHGVAAGGLPLGGGVGSWDHPFSTLAGLLAASVAATGLARSSTRILGAFLSPMIVGLTLAALLVDSASAAALPGALDSAWVVVHTLSVYASLALFSLAFGSGVGYLLAESRLRRMELVGGLRLPSLQVLDRVNHRAFSGGLVGLTLGIVAGTLSAVHGDGAGADLRAKILVTVGLWMLYALGWQARYVLGWGGRRSAWLAIVGFVGLIASVVGVAHA